MTINEDDIKSHVRNEASLQKTSERFVTRQDSEVWG